MINQWPQGWSRVYRWLDRQERFAGNFKVFFTLKTYFRRLLAEFEPDVIVSVYPAYSHIMDEMFGPSAHLGSKRVVVITDSLSVNAIWYRCAADYFLLPNPPSAAVLHQAGIAPDKTRTFGFPVSPEFAEPGTFREPPTENTSRVLYLVNARKAFAPELVLRLASIPGISLTVAVGRDRRLRKSITDIQRLALRKFELVGWSEELPAPAAFQPLAHQQGRWRHGAGSNRRGLPDDRQSRHPRAGGRQRAISRRDERRSDRDHAGSRRCRRGVDIR
jgi:processive 1,2-diacylglycerol beta-glucosyltransferase